MENQTIYSRFEKEIDGKIRKFWVQPLPEDQKQIALEYFCKYFIRDEPMSKSLRIIEDEKSMEYCKNMWWSFINQNRTLACFTELENGQNQMVAANFCYEGSTNEKVIADNEPVPEAFNTILEVLEYINHLRDVSKELGTTKYLGAMGLIVIPEYRGYNLGLHLLEARRVLCKKHGLKATITHFTSPASQRLAEKAGFKDLVSITYDDLEKKRPSLRFPNINNYSKCIRYMYILYE